VNIDVNKYAAEQIARSAARKAARSVKDARVRKPGILDRIRMARGVAELSTIADELPHYTNASTGTIAKAKRIIAARIYAATN
jgi:hypothetical protein